MEENILTIKDIQKKVFPAFISLLTRQATLQAITWININFFLIRILPLSTIGIFDIATAIVNFFAFFSDIGLAASLIQKKEHVSEEDISTTFTIQILLVSALSIAIILAAPLFVSIYKLAPEALWLIRALGFGFFLSSLKVVPSVLMERKLNFKPVVTTDITQALLFNIVLTFLVLRGFNLWSYTAATIIQGVVGVVLIYSLVPVKLKLGIHRDSAKNLLKFGIPFQLNNLLAMLKDRLVPLVVAGMVGPVGVAYIEWSQAYALLPIQLMSNISTVTFPAFSRLQDDKEALGDMLEKSLFITSLLMYPAIFGIAAVLPSVIAHVISSKMLPALPSFYFFAFSVLWSIISSTFTNVLNAIGKIKTTLWLMVMWTVLTWGFTPLLVLKFGFVGVAITSFLISFSSVLTIILVKKVLKVRVLNAITLPIVASALMALFVWVFAQRFVRNEWTLLSAILFGILLYGSVVFVFGRKRVVADLKMFKK